MEQANLYKGNKEIGHLREGLKYRLLVLKETVSVQRFFSTTTTYVETDL